MYYVMRLADFKFLRVEDSHCIWTTHSHRAKSFDSYAAADANTFTGEKVVTPEEAEVILVMGS